MVARSLCQRWGGPRGSRPGWWARPGALLVVMASLALGEPVLGQTDTIPPEPALRGELRIHPDDTMEVTIIARDRTALSPGLLDRARSGEAEERVEGATIRLVWPGRARDPALEILREARAADEAFSLRVLMPAGTAFEDLWGFQAALSQAGIRRVQIVGGGP